MSDYVRSVKRALRILQYLADEGSSRNLSSIATALGLATSTTHRLLTTMETEKFVRFNLDDNEWQVGVSAFSVGSQFVEGRDIISLSKKYLRRLSTISGETSNVYIENNGLIVCLFQIESKHNVRAITRVGGTINVHCSAAGKAILAFRPRVEVEAILERFGMKRFTVKTITDSKTFFLELGKVVKDGFSTDSEENLEGLSCIAAPVFNEFGRAVSAISISGPSGRFTKKKYNIASEELINVANEITDAYGGQRPGKKYL